MKLLEYYKFITTQNNNSCQRGNYNIECNSLYKNIILLILYLKENQKDLEIATEQLSEYLERDITSDMLADIKQKVQDKYR